MATKRKLKKNLNTLKNPELQRENEYLDLLDPSGNDKGMQSTQPDLIEDYAQLQEYIRTVQQQVENAQRDLFQAEDVIGKRMVDTLNWNPKLLETVNLAQKLLVDMQMDLDQEEQRLGGRQFQHPKEEECEMTWNPIARILKIHIPHSWERVHTRPSIYIKDFKQGKKASDVLYFYSKLLHRILTSEREKGNLDGFTTFSECYGGFLFHYDDKKSVRDPDNQMIKILIDAAKHNRIFSNDDYGHFAHVEAGVYDPQHSGMSLFFSDNELLLQEVLSEIKTIRQVCPETIRQVRST